MFADNIVRWHKSFAKSNFEYVEVTELSNNLYVMLFLETRMLLFPKGGKNTPFTELFQQLVRILVDMLDLFLVAILYTHCL